MTARARPLAFARPLLAGLLLAMSIGQLARPGDFVDIVRGYARRRVNIAT